MKVKTASCDFLTCILAFALEQSREAGYGGQLIREDNRPLGLTYVYEYDSAGNILAQNWYSFTTATEVSNNATLTRAYTYEYGSDKMISFKGQAVTYDAIGNPKKYRGRPMTWQNGRQLASVQTNLDTYRYTYNADGLRIGKTNGTVTTEYILNGSQVMRQIISDGTNTYVADYLYHETGAPMAFAYYPLDGTPVYYFYDTNLQGDIVGIYDANGNKVVGFRYNAWGMFNTDVSNSAVCTDTFLRASLFRYRSYIYDYETGLYYLQSRYYDPEVGRFINADFQINYGILGVNLYAYCENNPINYTDYTGREPISLTVIAVITLCVIVVALFSPSSYEIEMSAEEHYERNDKNNAEKDISVIMNTYDLQDESMDDYHEYTTGTQGADAIYNNKYLSPDGGHFEVIICEPPNRTPYIVDEKVDAINMGTYNYVSNTLLFPIYVALHGCIDVLPYKLYGNTRADEDGWLKWLIS